MELLPPMVRGITCYCCGQPYTKYAVDWTIKYRDGDVKLRLPMCNACALKFDETLGPGGRYIQRGKPGL